MQIRFIRTLLFALVVLCMSAASFAQLGVLITFAPPPLPVYEQPLCPEDGYIWTPGYWAYGDDFDDYYWVPGTWVLAPEIGFLWTPGYWGWGGESFVFYDGYWGPMVGFYGGINYGFGYFGEGYEGGRWDNGHFFYNSSVNNVNETVVHNVYNTTVINRNETHVSYNGGNGGINAHPTPQQEGAAHEKHIPPVPVQNQHAQAARTNPQQRASVNMGKPPVAATPKPGVFNHPAVVPAKAPGAPYTPPANRGGSQPRNNASAPANSAPANSAPRPETSAPRPDNNASRTSPPAHPRDLPPAARPSAPNTGDPKLDQKYQQQQEKVFAKQEQERQKLQQKQDQEHQRLMQQNASEGAKQQVEQRHQQQTQQLQQRHEQQQQQLQQKQQPPSRDRSKPPN